MTDSGAESEAPDKRQADRRARTEEEAHAP